MSSTTRTSPGARMSLASVLAAALFFQAVPDTVSPAVPEEDPAGAYRDSAAATMVRRARARSDTTSREIQGYRVTARLRGSAGLRAFGRERLLYRRESVARVEWERDAPARVEVLAAREVAPVVDRDPSVGSDEDHGENAVWFAFEPDRGWLLRIPGAEDDASVVHPLAAGSEEHYLFRSGDPTTLLLPGGRTIRLVELQVIPRRQGHGLVSGSLWLDAESYAPVRGAFRLSLPTAVGVHGEDRQWGIPGRVEHLAIEYGLWEGRWWLPRLLSVEGSASVGSLHGLLRFEQTYEGYEIFTEPASAGRPESSAPWGDTARVAGYESRTDSTAACRREHGSGGGVCREVQVWYPKDRSVLLSSEHLPPSIFADGATLVSDAEIREAVASIASLERAATLLQRPSFHWSPVDPGLLRYNRVEGARLGSSAGVGLGNLELSGSLWLGTADRSPGFQVDVARSRPGGTERLGIYRRLDAFAPRDRPFAPGNSLSALAFGLDRGDYFRALGLEVAGAPPLTAGLSYAWRIFAERQTPVEKSTDFSLSRVLGGAGFRPNPAAQRADQFGAAASIAWNRGLDPEGWRQTVELEASAEGGSYPFLRPGLRAFLGAPLPGPLIGGIEVGAGTSVGEVPLQRLWYLGGPATVRGIGDADRIGGEAFWRGRAELATAFPGARLVVFGDAGWAGDRRDATLDPALVSAGVGASFLDGLVRVDLARALRGGAGWRLELYLGGPL